MQTNTTTTLRHRNSITVPTKLNLSATTNGGATTSPPQSQSQSLDLYTSLKDLLSPSLAAAVNSPRPSSPEISIRNRLVKQAAWAYLQPMSSSPSSSGHHFLFFHRMWEPIVDFAKFIRRTVILPISRAFDRVVKAVVRISLMR